MIVQKTKTKKTRKRKQPLIFEINSESVNPDAENCRARRFLSFIMTHERERESVCRGRHDGRERKKERMTNE